MWKNYIYIRMPMPRFPNGPFNLILRLLEFLGVFKIFKRLFCVLAAMVLIKIFLFGKAVIFQYLLRVNFFLLKSVFDEIQREFNKNIF